MVAKGGQSLLQEEAIEAVRKHLVPLATVITPNVPEAGVIIGEKGIASLGDMEEAARKIHRLGAQNVVLKGGHLHGEESTDVLFDGNEFTYLPVNGFKPSILMAPVVPLPAAIAAGLAKGQSVLEATMVAKEFISCAIESSLAIGKGIGQTNHAAYRDRHR